MLCSYIPKESPDIGCCEVDPIVSTVLVNLDLLGNGSICEHDHLIMSG